MYYLKCNNCGHLNEVKSEYLIFCAACNKKLVINFRDWQLEYPDKSLEDFKKQICVSDEDVANAATTKKAKPKGLIIWISFILLFAALYGIGHFGGESIVNFLKSEKTSDKVFNRKWIRETYGSYGLTVETPAKLTKGDLPLPADVRQLIDKMETYNYLSAKGFKVMISSVKYKPLVGQISLEGAASGAISQMKAQKGVTDFEYSEDYISKNDIPGFIQKGRFKQSGVGIEFIGAGFSKGLVFWQIFVSYQINDDVGRKAAERVIDSIEIKETTNTQ